MSAHIPCATAVDTYDIRFPTSRNLVPRTEASDGGSTSRSAPADGGTSSATASSCHAAFHAAVAPVKVATAEHVDHLPDHFTAPVVIRDGHDNARAAVGFCAATRARSTAEFTCPDGAFRADGLGARQPPAPTPLANGAAA
ncbi:hypothetical protein [Streptomyces beihaiensis]|uniref:Uncharacterized protein n=1 Tax=Streptomyces beihaiensis TaxID=2984495 RepID=A0ABT3TSF6_9ACTN|nr:hypothetical protein [Streptomyces beihaiensis]MCX3059020.1 hypothetical protein [Streptomyces beihaiensis]